MKFTNLCLCVFFINKIVLVIERKFHIEKRDINFMLNRSWALGYDHRTSSSSFNSNFVDFDGM